MKRLTRTTFLAISLAITGMACAQGYIGASLGQSNAKFDCSGTTSCDKTDTAFKVFGGYMFTPNWGLEGAYYNQGKAKLTAVDPTLGTVTGEFKGDGAGLYGLAVLPLDNSSVFAKLGVVSARVKLNAASSVFGTGGLSERHTQAGWGLGAGHAFSKAWAARVEYERMRVKFMDEKVNVDLLTVGAVYRF